MRRKWFMLISALILLTAGPALAQFSPLVPGIENRPALLLETDYYVYGPGTGFDAVELNVTVNNRREFNEPVTLYLYWQNRETGSRTFYNARSGEFIASQRDLFGASPTAPEAVIAPNLSNFKLFGEGGAFGPMPDSIRSDTGRYQLVFEVRDAAGKRVIARSNAMYNHVDSVVQVSGDQNTDQTWTSNNAYFLSTPVNVGTQNATTLTIEAGTVVLGSTAGQGTLVVRPGSVINAQGSATFPIIFTSEQPVGTRAPGDWGGLVISGNAPTNQDSPEGEGDSGPYGGNQPNDTSGILSYVRVEFAGIRFSEQNELNGIALQGVGRGTVVDHVQVHFNQDDGIEFFGGTVNAKYVLITDARDDSVDWTFGWNGSMQHVVVIQRHEQADKGIEADNFESNPTAQPTSNPTIYNATFVGNAPIAARDASVDTGSGLLFRRGTLGTFSHFIVTNFWEEGIEVDGDASNAAFGNALTVENSFFFNNEQGEGFSMVPQVRSVLLRPRLNNSTANPRLPNPNSIVQPDVVPLPGSPARDIGTTPPNDGFFDQVSYAGGVDPANPWIYEGWTTFSDN